MVKIKQILTNKLRSSFFQLTSTVSYYSYNQVLSAFTDELAHMLDTNCGLIIYNNWLHEFELVSGTGKVACVNQMVQMDYDLFRQLSVFGKTEKSFTNEDIVVDQTSEMNLYTLPLKSVNNMTKYLFISIKKESPYNNLLSIIKEETENFLRIISYYYINKTNNKINEYLRKIGLKFSSITNLTDVLEETIQSLEEFYPDFSYYLMLAQDYEVDQQLPIKRIEYNNEECVSADAFMKSTTQLEYGKDNNETNLYVPLKGSQGTYGVLHIIAHHFIDFPEREIDFINKFAETSGKAIENAILYENSNHLVRDLKLINKVTHKLNMNLQQTEIVSIIKEQVIDICSPTQIGFVFTNQEFNSTQILEESSSYFKSEQGHSFIKYLTTQIGKSHEAIFNSDFQRNFKQLPYRSLIAIPMINENIMNGFVVIMHEKDSFFSFSNFKLLQSLIQHSTLTLSNSLLKERLQQSVITDYLTKLYSRKYLDDLLHKHMETDQKGTLVLFDIDDFKKINDTYGHYIGDKVITQVAAIIKRHSRQGDIPTRWGGEEIAIYLPNVGLAIGVQLARRISKKVAKLTDPHVTISSGVASWDTSRKDSVTELFIRADQALYEAKSQGKNKVVTEKVRKF